MVGNASTHDYLTLFVLLGNNQIWRRKYLSDSAASKPKPASASAEAKVEEEGWSLRARLIFFSIFVTAGGVGTLSYTLTTDEEMLFYVYDNYPWVVTTLGPYIGLPMVEETGNLDEEEYFPRDVTELVGETVTAAAKLRSGRVVVIQAPSETSSSDIERLVLEKLGAKSLFGDSIVNVEFIDQDQESSLASKSDDQLREAFAIQLEPLPTPGSVPRAALEALLHVYRVNEIEFKTQVQLGSNHNFDTSQYQTALQELERRKQAVKEMMKTAPR